MRFVLPVIGLVYPILVFVALLRFEPRTVALLVGALLVVRLALRRGSRDLAKGAYALAAGAGIGVLFALAAWLNDERFLRLLPALINLVLLLVAGASLLGPASFIESFARMQVAHLSAEELRYCRAVTWVWCVFFALNGSIAFWLAVSGSREAWALYTGLISYLLIGALFAVEFVVRHYRFRRYLGSTCDPLLKRFFPPREAR